MATRSRLKLRQTKESLVDKLARVVRDVVGEVLANALEENPTGASAATSPRFNPQSTLRDSPYQGCASVHFILHNMRYVCVSSEAKTEA